MSKLTDSEIQALHHKQDIEYFSKWREDWFELKTCEIGGKNGLREYKYRLRIKSTQEEFSY